MDEESRKLIQVAYDRTLALIEAKKVEVSKLAEQLLSAETLNVDDVVRLIGRRPFAYQGTPGAEYLKDSHTAAATEAEAGPAVASEKDTEKGKGIESPTNPFSPAAVTAACTTL
jgi:AFG3 family protein